METSPDPEAGAARPRAGSLSTVLDLVGDPSPKVWRGVRRELESAGTAALPHLRRLARAGAPRARARARALLTAQERERAARRLAGFAASGRIDLERGLLLIARFASPGLDLRPVLVALDAHAAEVASRIEGRPPTVETALELARHLGGELGYEGDRDDYHHPDNAHMGRTVARRRGLPLTLCALYRAVARRCGLQAELVGLPGHVVLRLQAADAHALVDPFRGGARIRERDCLEYLARNGLPFRPEWFAGASDEAMFARAVRNLRRSYAERGLRREVRLLERVLAVLARRGLVPQEAS